MGLFKKESKKKPAYFNVELADFDVRWKSFSEALPALIDTGSQDVKKSEFKLSEGTYILFSHDGLVKGILPPSSTFTVKKFLEIVPAEDLPAEVRDRLTNASQADDLFRYDTLVAAVPEASDFLAKLFQALHVESALRLSELMKTQNIQVPTEPLFSEALESSILAWNFLDKTPDELTKLLELQEMRKETALSRMKAEELTNAPLLLKDSEWIPTTVAENFILQHAQNRLPVKSLMEGPTDGLLTSTLLETLERVILEKRVVIEGREEKADEALPDVDALSKENDDASAFTDVEREELPQDDVEGATWEFEEGLLDGEDEHPHFTPTGFMNVNLRDLLTPVLEDHPLDEELLAKVEAHLIANENLEKEVLSVEDRILPLSKEYRECVSSYDEMKFTKSLDDLENDGADPAEAEVESVESDKEMTEVRDESNNEFFGLAKLEEERYRLNENRKKELYGLLSSVPFEGDDARTIELQDAIEAKISGIDHVRTVAFHVNPDAKAHEKLVEELVDEKTLEGKLEDSEGPSQEESGYIVDIDSPDDRENSNAFIYYQLVDEMGIDPIELYKEDMRIKRDGGNPHIPRPTKYSKSLNARWEELQKEKENAEATTNDEFMDEASKSEDAAVEIERKEAPPAETNEAMVSDETIPTDDIAEGNEASEDEVPDKDAKE